jgi:hypothetical protein
MGANSVFLLLCWIVASRPFQVGWAVIIICNGFVWVLVLVIPLRRVVLLSIPFIFEEDYMVFAFMPFFLSYVGCQAIHVHGF